MKTLLDTNILTLSIPARRFTRRCGEFSRAATPEGDELCLVPQNLYELWAVCTRPAEQNGLA